MEIINITENKYFSKYHLDKIFREVKKSELKEQPSFRMMEGVAKYMDGYFLDPIIGFFVPGVGDIITVALAVPFVYFCLTHLRSIPLTLAVLFNTLVDMAIGLVPFIGDIADAFHKSNKKNMNLVLGFVNDDPEVIAEVNEKAKWMAVGIGVMCLIIYGLLQLLSSIFGSIFSIF